MTLDQLRFRTQVVQRVRRFFDERNFQEVIVPSLNLTVPGEPTIHPFKTRWQTTKGSQPLYLTTSPESELKKMMALGEGNCYAISSCFRNLESNGPQHQPEFLMVEW